MAAHSVITWGRWYWPAYFAVVAVGFLPAEIYALITNVWNTLSYFAWHEMGIGGTYSPHTPGWWISLIAWCLFTVVITAHIWFVVHF